MFDKIILLVATGFGSGYLRPGPGTWGSLAAVGLLWLLGLFWQPDWLLKALLALPLLLVGAACAQRAGRLWRRPDDGRIVIDEWLGVWLATLTLPWNASGLALALLFFRIFDIFKPFPCGLIDAKLKNGWGVMLDDAVAGLYACASVYLLLWGIDSAFYYSS